MSLQQIWEWSYSSKTVDVLRNAKYAIPLIQSFHLFGLTLVLGTTVVFNLRLLGLGVRQISMPAITRQLWRLMVGGLFLSITTGILVFIPDPARYAANTAFKTKLVILLAAILFHFMLDTGATFVALSYETAQSLGLAPQNLRFSGRSTTANGVARVASVTIDAIRIESIVVKDVPAVVAEPGRMTQNLLGMSFIKQLSGFQLNGASLTMKE